VWRRKRRSWLVALITAVVLVPSTAYIFWLDHPSNPEDYTRVDDYLYGIGECGNSGWVGALVPFVVVAFLAAPILLVVSLVLGFQRHDWSWLALSLVAVMLLVFAMVAAGFLADTSYATSCD
jgi:hypothetical protein